MIYIEMAPERKAKIAKIDIFHNSGVHVLLHGESPSNQVPSEYKSLVEIYGNDTQLLLKCKETK